MDEHELKLEKIFRSVLGLEQNEPVTDFTRQAQPRWDSLRHVELLLKVQSEFKVKFTTAEVLQLNAFADFQAAIEKKLRL